MNAEEILFTDKAVAECISIVIQTDKFYIGSQLKQINVGQQIEELQKELIYLKGFLASVQKKLGNEKFVQNAKPEVIEGERKKQADAEAKIKTIEESLSLL